MRPPRSWRCISRASETPSASGASRGAWRAASPCLRSKVVRPPRGRVRRPPTRLRSQVPTRRSMRSSTRPACCVRKTLSEFLDAAALLSSQPLPLRPQCRRGDERGRARDPFCRRMRRPGSRRCRSPRVRRPKRCGRSCRPRAAAPIPSTCSARRLPRRSRPCCRSSSQMPLSMPSACFLSARCSPPRRTSDAQSTARPAWRDESSRSSQCCSRMRPRMRFEPLADVSTFASPESAAAALGVAAKRTAWLRRREGVVPVMTGVDRAGGARRGGRGAERRGRGLARRPAGPAPARGVRNRAGSRGRRRDARRRGARGRVVRRCGRGQVGGRGRAQDRDRRGGARPSRRGRGAGGRRAHRWQRAGAADARRAQN